MNKAFEKILDRLEEELIPLNQEITRYFYELKDTDNPKYIYAVGRSNALTDFKYDIKQLAEEFATDTNVGNNGWIPCSERLPEEPFGCLVTVIDCEPVTQTDFENILPYFVGYDGESWNDEDGNEIPFEVIAWQPLPEPFKERD